MSHHEHGLGNDWTTKEEVATMIRSVMAMVVFVRDLGACMAFYRDILGLELKESDAHSASFSLGNQYLILLEVSAAEEMISEGTLKLKGEGEPRGLLAAGVEDVDAAFEALKAKGVTLLRPPTDQPWGLRTAYFADPEGNVWEINQSIG